ncbi:hypothetical protein SCB49_02564 [unidentified eubacterium SCB49]|nr:hypothetical protein SCB49_02564 [unidentified eubacterium SCB49]
MLFDPSVTSSYIEDCEVCCNPIRVEAQFEDGEIVMFNAVDIAQ